MSQDRAPAPDLRPLRVTATDVCIFAVALAAIAVYAVVLFGGYVQHLWILDASGRPVVNDFIVFWVAAHLALKGAVLAAYDARREHAAELAAIGHTYHQVLGWSYPPLFLLIVVLPAQLHYVSAFIIWCTVTLALYALTVAAIAKRAVAFMVACAMPWVLVEFMLGQNGFLTAAVIGAALLQLEKRPLVSGLLLGFLSYKPQFGVLFPLALAAGGYWRAFGWAALSTLLWNGLAGAVFGFESYAAFLHALSNAADTHLVRSDLGWNKLQSVYGFARTLGAPGAAAWAMQALVSIAAALAVVIAWRSRNTPFELKGALLPIAILLATPYVLYYDVPVLAVAGAFLVRQRGFDRFEVALMAATAPFLLSPFLPGFAVVPGALFASLAMGFIAIRRLQAQPAYDFAYAG
ncbi:MAG TPA: glycosyltransferase family 87 protein [Rhizomicrobium sp.]|nr:glycosyltransferase family 87 protein [Rhizomicrobium sp.]